ncbi:MAG: radical SAM protein [Candidatus Cloacimonadota bacterium]|nr:radical SAM protein [Candidatus Cloacimonadota bacterium]
MNKKVFLKYLPKIANNFIQNRPINSVTEIKITHACNQKCRQCNIHEITTKPIHLNYTNFCLIAEKLEEYGCLVAMISGGEPLLNPDLGKILIYSKKIFPLSVSLVTGLYFDYAKISDIIDLCLAENINIQTSLDGLKNKGEYIRGVPKHSETVLKNMQIIAEKKTKRNSNSLLYANCVMSNLNLEQIPEIISACKNVGWKTTIGAYHSLIQTTKVDEEMKIRDEKKFRETVEFLTDNPDILNLNTFIEGLPRILTNDFPDFCPFVDGKRTSTRLTIFENGDLHLCKNGSIGNLLEEDLYSIFTSEKYLNRLEEYKKCPGCWGSCYTQKHLLTHPQTVSQFFHNIKKLLNLKTAAK